jgi:NADH dehydrogenase [ubiquinone] 1 alpha subcomplex assembly factor 6
LIPEHAKTAPIVLMRCQWWRDAVNAMYKGKPTLQPSLALISDLLRNKGAQLTRYRFQRIISTRQEDMMETQQPTTLAELESYAEGTAAQLLLLQLEAAGQVVEEGSAAETACMELGRAVGVVNLLKGTSFHAQRGRLYLPKDVMDSHGAESLDVLRGQGSEALRHAVREVAEAAEARLAAAQALGGELSPVARALMVPAVGVGMFLAALRKKGWDPFDPDIVRGGYSPLWYQLKIKAASMAGKY